MTSPPSSSSEKAQLQTHLDKLVLAAQEEDVHGSASPSGASAGGAGAGAEAGLAASPAASPATSPARGGRIAAARTTSSTAPTDTPNHEPPLYSGPASRAQEAAMAQEDGSAAALAAAMERNKEAPVYQGLPRLDYRLYAPPLFELSSDKTTISSKAAYLSTSPSALAAFVRTQATVPPKPLIVVTGVPSVRSIHVDFSVKMNLMSLLLPDDPRRRMHYVRCVGRGELAMRGGSDGKPSVLPEVHVPSPGGPGSGRDSSGGDEIDAWCRRYVADPAGIKTFVFERQVANLNREWLEGQIRSLVAATGYQGVVTVTFPVTHARVVVQTPDRVNKFFTSVATLFKGKGTYEVVKAVWPFATHKHGEPGRTCAVQSEEAWWREWRQALRYAISTKRNGYVTNEDRLEVLMEDAGKNIGQVDWGAYV
ncbi:hypothetical protein SPI_07681 [Niveomyces insectorum RCEF 264]|uniref:Uncharacterized protein n=1 Tax=Niveomyces insectorum RCEF 264 TaxID=1081102 RepID=A0A167PI20_9HYPO|nr:hypothetical protein SPI_07681 [Niveomyces insectorum RCEF 264]